MITGLRLHILLRRIVHDGILLPVLYALAHARTRLQPPRASACYGIVSDLNNELYLYAYIYIYIKVCVCVCSWIIDHRDKSMRK